MYKEAEVNTHNHTGMFPSRFCFLSFVFSKLYTYNFKNLKDPHGLLQEQTTVSLSFSSSLLPPSLWGDTLVFSSMFLIYKQVLLFLDFFGFWHYCQFPSSRFLCYKCGPFLSALSQHGHITI